MGLFRMMTGRTIALTVVLAGALGACAAPPEQRLGTDGRPLPQLYEISDADAVQFRLLDSVNALRQARGTQPLQLNAELNAAAATHSRDMSVQNRPWHFGSDGSSPLERANRVGYRGRLLGENISESYETELETLAAWMEDAATRDVILDPRATELGFQWFQEPSGKIWWTMVTGTEAATGLGA